MNGMVKKIITDIFMWCWENNKVVRKFFWESYIYGILLQTVTIYFLELVVNLRSLYYDNKGEKYDL